SLRGKGQMKLFHKALQPAFQLVDLGSVVFIAPQPLTLMHGGTGPVAPGLVVLVVLYLGPVIVCLGPHGTRIAQGACCPGLGNQLLQNEGRVVVMDTPFVAFPIAGPGVVPYPGYQGIEVLELCQDLTALGCEFACL